MIPAYTLYAEGAQRFDYFVTGGAGAALAFSLQAFDPGTLPVAVWLAPLGWALLLVALGAGLRHLQSVVAALKAGAMINDRASERRAIRDLLAAEPAKPAILVIDTGESLSRIQAEARARSIAGVIEKIEEDAEKNEGTMRLAYRVRNAAVVAGFTALALWKSLNVLL